MKSATKYVCPLCKSENIELKDYKIRDNKNDLRILKCKKCSMVFLSSFEHINQNFYKKGLMHSYSFNPQNWLNNSKEDDLRRFNLLKNEAKNKKVLDFGCGAGGEGGIHRRPEAGASSPQRPGRPLPGHRGGPGLRRPAGGSPGPISGRVPAGRAAGASSGKAVSSVF